MKFSLPSQKSPFAHSRYACVFNTTINGDVAYKILRGGLGTESVAVSEMWRFGSENMLLASQFVFSAVPCNKIEPTFSSRSHLGVRDIALSQQT